MTKTEEAKQREVEHYIRAVGGVPRDDFRKKEIAFHDTDLKPIEIQISLVEYFERIKKFRADRWQRNFCEWLQAAVENRHIKGSFGEFHAEPQLGKPLDVDSEVLMGDGSYKRLGDIVVGDYVISHTGTSRKVLQIFEQGELDVLSITANSGRNVIAALDHPFLTPEGWVEAQDLRLAQALGCVPEANTTGESSRSNEEFEMLGYFLGDGSVAGNACGVTSGDDLLTARILHITREFGWGHNVYRKPGGNCDTIGFSKGAREWIREAGIAGSDSWTKRVPLWVFKGSQEQIAVFIGAYFACDGTFGRQRNTVIDFGSVSIGLLQDVQKLLLRVGVQSRVCIKNGVYKGARHQSHRLYFCSQDFTTQFINKVPIYGIKGVQIKAIDRPRKTFQPQYLTDNIVAIESAGRRQCRCLEVDVDHTFTANDFIVHNTTILSQVFPAYCTGHDPFWRTALAMYNVSRSETHSDVIIGILRSQEHKEIFPNKDGHLPNVVSKTGWSTNARIDKASGKQDGQKTFSAVGLQSGITGSSADLYLIDDPYKDPKEAFSEQVRINLDRFWKFGIEPRLTPHSIIAAMFHRYSYDDFGGYLLDTGLFDYVRYATICDGPYIHEETGQKFEDPLGREIGEYISPERRPPEYYADKQKDPRVWNSMFMGRPSSEEGEFFQVAKIKKISPEEAAVEREQCSVMVRAWDNAATTGAGDYTAGALMGMKSDGSVIVFNMKLAQVDTAERLALQQTTAKEDGTDVAICIPKEQASAGKDNVFFTEQYLKEYSVYSRSVVAGGDAAASSAKARRAYNFSVAVNSGEVSYVSDDQLATKDKWNKVVLRCLRQFLLSTFDDPIDALGDGYNHLYEIIRRGLVIKNYNSINNLLDWGVFAAKFPVASEPCTKIPKNFTVYAGVKITADGSTPNSAVIVARAPVNARMGEKLFVVAEYKEWTSDYFRLFDWLDRALDAFCSSRELTTVWLHPDSAEYQNVLWQKLERPVAIFQDDAISGITELDWYLRPTDKENPFYPDRPDVGIHCLVHDPEQFNEAKDEFGLQSLRQEFGTWTYLQKGEKRVPSPIGAVVDCLRMVTFCFRTIATGLTKAERVEEALPDTLKAETLAEMPVSDEKDGLLTRRAMELKKVEKEINKPVRSAAVSRFARR